MKPHYRLKQSTAIATWIIAVTLVAGCAGRTPYKKAVQAEQAKDYDTAVAEYKAALDHNPGSIDYRLKYDQARFQAAFAHYENGRRAFEKNDLTTAKQEFQRALELDPTNDMARESLQKIEEIESSRERKEPEPQHNIHDLKEETRTDPTAQSLMTPKISGPISFKMTQDSRTIFETLADLAGFNVIFDRDFRGTSVSVNLSNVDIYQALDIVSLQTGKFWEPLNKNTILVSDDNQTKRREYEPQLLKTVYLANSVTSTEITEAITALRTILNMRYIAQSTAMNAIILRDTPDKIAIAEKILEDIDKSKPEVVVDAMILEVDRTDMLNLGLTLPTSTTIAYGPSSSTTTTTPTTSTGSTTSTTTTTTTAASTSPGSIPLNTIGNLNSSNFSITVPSITATALASNSNAKLLQNPKVRATDGKLASVRIGSKIPVPSGSFQPAFVGATGTPVVQYVYQDIGVNLDITPHVMLNREVSLLVQIQVSALAGNRDAAGLELPVFTNRSITHEIRLAEGETNILGGIIQQQEQTSLSGIPGLKDIPILRYLFANSTKERDTTEIVVMLTPHIVRMPNLSEENLRGIYIGTEANTRVRPGSLPAPSVSPQPGPGASTTPESTPATPAPANTTPPAPARPLPPGVSLGPTTAPIASPPAQPRPTNTTISFSPQPVVLASGPATPVNIMVNGNDIYAADLSVSFDPAAVKIQEVRDGGFLSKDGQIVAVVQKIDSDTGTARISIERPPGASPLSGSGALVTLMLAPGARKGDSTVRVTDFRLRDAQQNVFVGQAAEARVTVP